ncbi:calcium-binding protein [Nostoc punctiforme UO1]|uniref:calcium-binding protein n=1 Tax=Nostoc punctiforme TaxID=272131 RepID=UPI0030991BEC
MNPIKSIDDFSLNQRLALVIEGVQQYLREFATSWEFIDKMRLAFGESFEAEVALKLAEAWQNQDFSVIPTIEFLSSAQLHGANGAYAAATERIYLSEEFVTQHQNDSEAIVNLVLEEVGHRIDGLLNTVDSAGDEGAIFAALVQGESLSDKILQTLKLEDDKEIIILNGQAITVEQQNFTGDEGNNNITGTIGDDLIEGLGGNDVIYGEAGNDILDGGAGNDSLNGNEGNNTYLFGKGDGQDLIQVYSDTTVGKLNTVQFKSGVLPSEVLVKQVYDNQSGSNTALELSIAGTTDKITINFFFYTDNPANQYNPVQQVKFADGTTWNIATILTKLYAGTEGGDTFNGTINDDIINGAGGNDTLFGRAGNDTLNGGDGNDVIYGEAGNDILDGGAGNDSLNGNEGNNTYLFGKGDGQDLIQVYSDTTASKLNTVQFKSGVLPSEVLVKQVYDNQSGSNTALELSIAGTTDKITINYFFYTDNPANQYNPLQQIKFADGTTSVSYTHLMLT